MQNEGRVPGVVELGAGRVAIRGEVAADLSRVELEGSTERPSCPPEVVIWDVEPKEQGQRMSIY